MAEGGGGHVLSKGIVVGPFNYVEQNGYLKILIGQFWGKSGGGGSLVALQSFCSLKKGTRTFNFRLIKSFHDILGLLGQTITPEKNNNKQINMHP